jgi:hypothetical protein
MFCRARHESRANYLNNSKQAAVSVFHRHSQQVPRYKTCSVRARYRHSRGGLGSGGGSDDDVMMATDSDAVIVLQRTSAPVFLSPERLKYLHAYASGMLMVCPISGKCITVADGCGGHTGSYDDDV